MSLSRTIRFITDHPLNHGRPLRAISRFVAWQIISRIKKDVEYSWIDGSKLIVSNGMTGATGNIYCSLHEYMEMSFLLHFLDETSFFLDVGANIGSYTVLAAAVCGAQTISVEADPKTSLLLMRNVEANDILDRVTVQTVAVGRRPGEVSFTKGKDTVNQVTDTKGPETQTVQMDTLDNICGKLPRNCAMKIDIEGYEEEAMLGAKQLLQSPNLRAIIIETVSDNTHKLLENAGFERYQYEPSTRVLTRTDQLSAANYLYLRDAEPAQERVKNAIVRRFRGANL